MALPLMALELDVSLEALPTLTAQVCEGILYSVDDALYLRENHIRWNQRFLRLL